VAARGLNSTYRKKSWVKMALTNLRRNGKTDSRLERSGLFQGGKTQCRGGGPLGKRASDTELI